MRVAGFLVVLSILAGGCGPVVSGETMMADAERGGGWSTLSGEPPLIIAHRGASGYFPAHTLEGYARAIELGADYIEPDLVITKDGVLVARHDNFLSTSTDVADHPEFADRKRGPRDFGDNAWWVPGFGKADWWIEDFTLAELKTLRARQDRPGRTTEYDGQFGIPTFDEIAALARAKSEETGREIGLYPEAKSPTYHRKIGLEFIGPMLATLDRHGYGGDAPRVFIQCFELDFLKEISGQTKAPLVMLLSRKIEDNPLARPTRPNLDLSEYADIVDAVGPDKRLLLDRKGRDTGFVAAAHGAGLTVHPWTFRSDSLPKSFATAEAEYEAFFRLGVDGLFTDFADDMAAARDAFIVE